MVDKMYNDGQIDFAKFVRKNAAETLEVLLQHFNGARPAPFDKVINNLKSLESAAIRETCLKDSPSLDEQIALSAAQVAENNASPIPRNKDIGL